MTKDELIAQLGLPRRGNYVDWFALDWNTFKTWFSWDNNTEEKRIYLRFDPPIPEVYGYYSFQYSYILREDVKKWVPNLIKELDFNIEKDVHCCRIGVFMGNMFFERLESPQSGIFVNLIDLERFKGNTKTIIEKNEILFYIDYSNTQIVECIDKVILEKLKKLKSLSERGVGGERDNAKRMLQELLNKYNIKESDL